METRHIHNKTITKDKKEFSFSKEEDLIMLLNAIFKYGYSDFSSIVMPDMSKEERLSVIESALKEAKIAIDKKPSIIEWLNSGIFENDESNIPLALLLIGLYEICSLCEQKSEKCNFRYGTEKKTLNFSLHIIDIFFFIYFNIFQISVAFL